MARVNEIRKIPIHESLTQKMLIMGCEPLTLVIIMILALIPISVMFVYQELLLKAVIFDAILVVFSYTIAKILAREEGQMFTIILRHSSYQTYYLAHEGYPGKTHNILGMPINPIKTFDTTIIL